MKCVQSKSLSQFLFSKFQLSLEMVNKRTWKEMDVAKLQLTYRKVNLLVEAKQHFDTGCNQTGIERFPKYSLSQTMVTTIVKELN